ILQQLDAAGFLDGPGFESYYAQRLEAYRAAPYRPLRDASGFGAPLAALPEYLEETLAEAEAVLGETDGRGAGGAGAAESASGWSPRHGARRRGRRRPARVRAGAGAPDRGGCGADTRGGKRRPEPRRGLLWRQPRARGAVSGGSAAGG